VAVDSQGLGFKRQEVLVEQRRYWMLMLVGEVGGVVVHRPKLFLCFADEGFDAGLGVFVEGCCGVEVL
jgi:hypothetical protein